MGLFGHAPLAAGNLQNKPEPEPTLRLLSSFITLIIVPQKEELESVDSAFRIILLSVFLQWSPASHAYTNMTFTSKACI